MTVHEVAVVDLQEPVITLVLLQRPVTSIYANFLCPAPTPSMSSSSGRLDPHYFCLCGCWMILGEKKMRMGRLRGGSWREGVKMVVKALLLLPFWLWVKVGLAHEALKTVGFFIITALIWCSLYCPHPAIHSHPKARICSNIETQYIEYSLRILLSVLCWIYWVKSTQLALHR